MVFVWAISFSIFGMLLGNLWIRAYNLCDDDEKWIMITPIWIFSASSFGENGNEIRTKALVYSAICLIHLGLFASGIISS